MNQGIRYILRTCLHCKKKKIRVKQVYNTYISDWEDVEPWICEDCWKGARENERDQIKAVSVLRRESGIYD